jgi:hypothetical protein
MKQLVRGVGAAVVAAILLLPRVTEAEAVEDYEREGEFEDDGQRFQSVVVNGSFVAAANAPGGWTLVRTYENKSDEAAHIALEERVCEQWTMRNARVTPSPKTVLSRTQKVDLGPHEKKTIGVYLPESITTELTRTHKIKAGIDAQIAAGKYDMSSSVTYNEFNVVYLRQLAPGETLAVHERNPDLENIRPAAMPGPLAPFAPQRSAKAKAIALPSKAIVADDGAL